MRKKSLVQIISPLGFSQFLAGEPISAALVVFALLALLFAILDFSQVI